MRGIELPGTIYNLGKAGNLGKTRRALKKNTMFPKTFHSLQYGRSNGGKDFYSNRDSALKSCK